VFAPRVAKKTPDFATPPKTQAKLTIASSRDPLDVEADRVADQVLRSDARANRARSPSGAARSANAQNPSGQPLDPTTRAFFEPRFGYDFSRVRIHADEVAAQSAHSMGASACTSGPNIAFGPGRYRPGTAEGNRLLAHELTHVVQQGHASAASGTGAINITTGRSTPAIQRDTPAGSTTSTPQNAPQGPTSATGPMSVTKRYEDLVSRQDVTQALTDFLYRAQAEQGGQTLHVTDAVRWAVRKLFAGDATASARIESFLSGTALPGSAPDFAAAVTKLLPEFIPRSRMAHLSTQLPKDEPDTRSRSVGDAAGRAVVDSTVAPMVRKLPIPKNWQDKIIDGAVGAVGAGIVGIADQAMSDSPLGAQEKSAIHNLVEAAIKQKAGSPPDRQREGAGSPYAQPPPTAPSMGSVAAPGEHIFTTPKIPWDFPTKPLPKPNLPQAPLASDSEAVKKIIQSLDDKSLIPAAALGTPDAANYASAKELARQVADLLAAADKKKQYSVELTIGMNYRHAEDLSQIFDKISSIVRQVAGALPGGAANVGEVIITPARSGKDDKFPARRILKLHGGD